MFQDSRNKMSAARGGVITFAIALTAVVVTAAPAAAQDCADGLDGEGNVVTMEICGTVWDDLNGNGIQDLGEPGIEGIEVKLYQSGNDDGDGDGWDELGGTTTDSIGYYSFDIGDVDLYKIIVSQPAGLEPTSPNVGSDDAVDSDGTNHNGTSIVENLDWSTSDIDVDFGFHTTGVVVAPGTGTPGYWKNHPEAWPYDTITIGEDTYTKDQAISFMGKVSKDKTVTIFSSWLAATLNVAVGNDSSCVADALAEAGAWLDVHEVGSGVPASSAWWAEIEDDHKVLDNYNNGRLPCAQHRN